MEFLFFSAGPKHLNEGSVLFRGFLQYTLAPFYAVLCNVPQFSIVMFMSKKVDQDELAEMLCHLHQIVRVGVMKNSCQMSVSKVLDVATNSRISCKFRMNRSGLPPPPPLLFHPF